MWKYHHAVRPFARYKRSKKVGKPTKTNEYHIEFSVYNRAAQCIDKEILIRKIHDIGIDIDMENFEKLIRYWYW